MYKLFKLSAYEKQEITPEIHAIQHDSARVIPVWISDVDFSNVAAEQYTIMSNAFPTGYKQTEDYYSYNSQTSTYTYVPWSSLQNGTIYYKRNAHIRVIVRKPSGRRVVKDCERCFNYAKMQTAYSVGNKEYKSSYEYFSKNEITDVYTPVAFASLVAGTTYYKKANTVILIPLNSISLAECGTSIGQIQLDYSNGNGQIVAFKFFIKVEKSYVDGSIAAANDVNIGQIISQMSKTIADLPEEEFLLQNGKNIYDYSFE